MLSISLTLESITFAESQIIRALSGVSTVAAGLVGRPDKLAIVPQHPLVPTTPLSLLDFVIYPRQLEPKDEAVLHMGTQLKAQHDAVRKEIEV